jgi:2-keto-3-deoxy-L-rhamnonate aldolase RhmA
MELPKNRFKQAIGNGELQIGLWSQLAGATTAEVLADAGYDFVVIDAEHAPNDVLTVIPQLQVLDRSPTDAVVRLPWNDLVLAKRYLDIGAQTLLVPYVQNAEEARRAVFGVRYPPLGGRGVGTMHRANRYGRIKDYLTRADSEICLLVQVETEESLDRLEEIAAVDGIDGVFIGPSDLSASMGHVGNPGHPDVQAAIAAVPRRLRSIGKPAGILTPVEAEARQYIAAGYVYVAVGSDLGVLANQTTALAARFRESRAPGANRSRAR